MLPEHRKEFIGKLKSLIEEVDRADVELTDSQINIEYQLLLKRVEIILYIDPRQGNKGEK